MPRSAKIEFGMTLGEDERDYTIKGSLSPGSPGSGPRYDSGGEPAEASAFDLDSIVDDLTGEDVTKTLKLTKWESERIDERALEDAGDSEESAREAYWDSRPEPWERD